KNSLNRLIRCVCGKKIGPDPRNFNQRVSLGRNDLLIRTFPNAGTTSRCSQRIKREDVWSDIIMIPGRKMMRKYAKGIGRKNFLK
ncbi:hypothetical protein ACO1YZ_14800, partial [Klebsiella quasipneumoniae subsp. similipneumoniae]